MNPIHITYAVNGLGGSRYSGGRGPAEARFDALSALASSGAHLSIFSPEKVDLPAWSASLIPRDPDWLVPPETKSLQPVMDRTLPARLGRWAGDCAKDWKFRKRIERMKPDLLWVEEPLSHRFITQYRDWQPSHSVMMLHGTPDQFNGRYIRIKSELDRVIEEMAHYHTLACVSSRVIEYWKEIPALRVKKWIYLPNCAAEEAAAVLRGRARSDVRRDVKFPDDRFVVVCPATVQFRKGQDLLVEQVASLVRAHPELLVVLVGGVLHNHGGQEVVNQVQKHKLENHVLFVGQQSDAMPWIYAADAVVLPSREEAMPKGILEAMVLGTPVIGSNVCGIPEMIEDGVCGLLFDLAQPDRLGRHLQTLLEDAAKRGTPGPGRPAALRGRICPNALCPPLSRSGASLDAGLRKRVTTEIKTRLCLVPGTWQFITLTASFAQERSDQKTDLTATRDVAVIFETMGANSLMDWMERLDSGLGIGPRSTAVANC